MNVNFKIDFIHKKDNLCRFLNLGIIALLKNKMIVLKNKK